jgi:starvation-inducible DNA-binding protein
MTATARSPITSPIGREAQDITGKALQGTLVDLVDLHLMAKQAHWNVTGRFFRSVHQQLDELVTTARNFADEVAERSAALGVPPDARARTVAEDSNVPDIHKGWKDTREVVEHVVEALGKVIQRIRARIDETDKTDQVTHDLLTGLSHSLEKAHWMWQAQLADE